MALPAIPADDMLGLEDLSMSDVALPRINILGIDGVFEHSLSRERFERLDCVILGLVRQRILWPAEMGDEKSPPLCRSMDFKVGTPSADFPLQAAGLKSLPDVISCETCALKEWGSHPQGKRPWCGEQWHFAIMLLDNDGAMSPAIWTVRSSGITPARGYLSSFLTKRKPSFTNVTHVTLDQRKRGTVRYSVPIFAMGDRTDAELYPVFRDTYLAARSFLQTERTADEDTTTTVAAPAPKSKSKTILDDEPLEDF